MSYADLYQPTKPFPAQVYNITLIITAFLLLAFSAQLAFPLPISPVPITAQTLIVLLLAAFLGKKRAGAAVGVYLMQGALGLPVFAAGKSGLGALLGPTGGYLFGFLAAAVLVGHLIEQGWDRNLLTSLSALILGNGMIYLCGLLWLAPVVGPQRVLALGLYPFLTGDLLKIFFATIVLTFSGQIKSTMSA